MPRFLAPSHSGVHRLACLSLYHALLSQAAGSWLSGVKSRDLRSLITTRFRRDRDITSPSKISGSLNAGYEALDLLQSCSQGNMASLARVDDLLAKTKSFLNSISHESQRHKFPSPSPPKAQQKQTSDTSAINVEQQQRDVERRQQHPILSRPRLHVRGIRRVPVLVNARGVPFLRIKKPQPPTLSRTINGKLNKMWERILRRQRLERELLTAGDEDEWDRLTGQEEPTRWVSPLHEALVEVGHLMDRATKRDRELSYKMWDVVLRERELAEKEKKRRERRRIAADSRENGSDSEAASQSPDHDT